MCSCCNDIVIDEKWLEDNYSKTDEYKNLYKNQEWVNNKVKKGKNTCLKRYNVDSYLDISLYNTVYKVFLFFNTVNSLF